MRRPRTPRPGPPRPRGLQDESPSQDEQDGEQGLADFEPIVLKSRRTKHTSQDGTTQDEQDQDQDETGIQDLIVTAVQQSVEPQLPAEGAETATTEAEEKKTDDDEGGGHERETEAQAASKAKRSSFSLDEKRRVLMHLAASKSVRETIEKFYPDLPPEDFNTRRRTIWRWRTCAEQIVAGCADDKASARKKMRPRGIVCHRGPRQAEPQDVVDRLLTSVKKSEQRSVKRKGNRILRPAPPVVGLLAEQQIDALVFSSLGLPPTTHFPNIQPAPEDTAGHAGVLTPTPTLHTMHPLEHGEGKFAIRRR
ncbi:unnamed protein product [Phytophthora lilii]|uniref:Unnamed protein product n=1 Tax=Phytophthora lilii TaxID=2077276 RepID=A0A9W6TQH1_9STRA|nr:unnamed protein product [Phytophthora lilii]